MSKIDLKAIMGILVGFFILAYLGLPGLVSVFAVNTDGTAATQTLTISGIVSDAQTVTVGAVVYEFDIGNNGTVAGRVNVSTAGNATAIFVADALNTAIDANATSSALVTASNPTATTVLITADAVGLAANSYATTETMTNGAWGAATMTGGEEATNTGVATLVTTVVAVIIALAIVMSLLSVMGIRVFGN